MKKLLSSVLILTILAGVYTAAPVCAVSKPKLTVKNTSSGIKLSWKKNGSKKFKILRKAGKGSYKTLKTVKKKYTFTDKTVKSGQMFYYKITAGKKTSAVKKIMYLSTPELKIIEEPGGEIRIYCGEKDGNYEKYETYKEINGSKGFEIYQAEVKNNKTGKYKKIEPLYEGGEYATLFVLPKQPYKYKVRVYNGKYKSAFSKVKKFTSNPDVSIDAKPDNDYNGLRLTWSHIGASEYYVYKAVGKAGNFKKIATVTDVYKTISSSIFLAECNYVDKDVTEGTVYYYYVVANAGGTLIKQKDKTRVTFNKCDEVLKLKVGESFTKDDIYDYFTITPEEEKIVDVSFKISENYGYNESYTITALKPGVVYVTFEGYEDWVNYWYRYKVVVE